jgi:hypothetical protein
VRAYAATWIVKRRERDLDWKGDEGRLRHHVLPALGELPIADVRARHLVDLFHKLRTDKERQLALKTVYNVCACCSAMLRDARLAELIEQSPCILDERQLGLGLIRIPSGARMPVLVGAARARQSSGPTELSLPRSRYIRSMVSRRRSSSISVWLPPAT